ncbi:Dual specificity kinase 1 [Mycena sanguinolenta]|uniref:Dual specificity kinase 1 n=1 Tax=Mycena sanguinolenta TaxID=230812 RepID=A0A8H6XTB6_9AGAR|nr:Dual specificity kinase 1 [Mycena sanguinolenta]
MLHVLVSKRNKTRRTATTRSRPFTTIYDVVLRPALAPPYLEDYWGHIHQNPMASGLLEGIISSAKASISVILVLAYGYGLRKLNFVSQEGERDLARLCAKFFLPALLFTEIGPLTTASNMRNYWPIIPLSLFFQGVAFMVAVLSRMAGMPQHYVPMFIFNNVTSLPLLLINALAATGGLDPLVTGDRTLESALKIGRVYILINALVGNLARFALGPYLMKADVPKGWIQPDPEGATEEDSLLPGSGNIALPTGRAGF